MDSPKRSRIKPKITNNARELRKNLTVPERLLWDKLRNKQLMKAKFRKQHSFRNYIADFYCAEAGLVIEIDGRSHDSQIEYDTIRTDFIQKQGLKIIRFTNDDVIGNLTGVLESIALELGYEDDEVCRLKG